MPRKRRGGKAAAAAVKPRVGGAFQKTPAAAKAPAKGKAAAKGKKPCAGKGDDAGDDRDPDTDDEFEYIPGWFDGCEPTVSHDDREFACLNCGEVDCVCTWSEQAVGDNLAALHAYAAKHFTAEREWPLSEWNRFAQGAPQEREEAKKRVRQGAANRQSKKRRLASAAATEAAASGHRPISSFFSPSATDGGGAATTAGTAAASTAADAATAAVDAGDEYVRPRRYPTRDQPAVHSPCRRPLTVSVDSCTLCLKTRSGFAH